MSPTWVTECNEFRLDWLQLVTTLVTVFPLVRGLFRECNECNEQKAGNFLHPLPSPLFPSARRNLKKIGYTRYTTKTWL